MEAGQDCRDIVLESITGSEAPLVMLCSIPTLPCRVHAESIMNAVPPLTDDLRVWPRRCRRIGVAPPCQPSLAVRPLPEPSSPVRVAVHERPPRGKPKEPGASRTWVQCSIGCSARCLGPSWCSRRQRTTAFGEWSQPWRGRSSARCPRLDAERDRVGDLVAVAVGGDDKDALRGLPARVGRCPTPRLSRASMVSRLC